MKRNNAAVSEGVSRMSPWIHYGMISVTRIVRDAASIGGKGAEKFLDEVLVFREHAQHHVHATSSPDDWTNIPGWAISSWNEKKPGNLRFVPDTTREGEVGRSALGLGTDGTRQAWNYAQQREDDMGQGICWLEEDAEEAMHLALEMNDRFALDGRDPAPLREYNGASAYLTEPLDPLIR